MNNQAEQIRRRLEQGRSGYILEALPNNTVKKVSAGAGELGRRLQLQCLKQRTFTLNVPGVKVCPVVREGAAGAHYWFEMPLIRADSFVSFADKANVARIRRFEQEILELIKDFLVASPIQPVPTEFILAKSIRTYETIRPGLLPDEVLGAYHHHLVQLEALKPNVYLPVGKCHGDLTFSNILFGSDGDLILIDFLDVYIESPIFDMVKVLQETSLSWSRMISTETSDGCKANVLASYLDKFFRKEFECFDFFKRVGGLIEFQNLLRLVPYLPDGDVLGSVFQQMLTVSRRSSNEISATGSR